MPIFHPRPARTPLLVGLEWFVENFPQLCGGGVLITASATIADYGAPSLVTLPIGLLSAWPLGVVVRETVHSVRCWHIRQRRLHAEFLRKTSDQPRSTFVAAERVADAAPAQLEPAALEPARPLVIEGEVVPPAAERRR